MSMPDGGPAFPCMPPQDTAAGVAVGYPYPDQGMTLRDYFAAQVLNGICASEHHLDRIGSFAGTAEMCYELADNMLKERQTK